jgi:hypothetical protein
MSSRKKNMAKAMNVSEASLKKAQDQAELMKQPLGGWVTLEVRKVTFKETGTPMGPAERPLVAPLLHLFCTVDGDPRPVNLSFINTNPEKQAQYEEKLGHLFRALGTTDIDKMEGVKFRALVSHRENESGRFYHNYWAQRMEPLGVDA